MSTTSPQSTQAAIPAPQTTQVYQVFIRSTPEKIWQAITEPEFTARYFHGSRITATAERYASPTVPTATRGATRPVMEFDPPRRLVHGWRSMYDPELAAEPESRVTWEIEPREEGLCLLTVIHDQLDASPKTAASVTGPGWTFVVSGLKTLLETGEPLVA